MSDFEQKIEERKSEFPTMISSWMFPYLQIPEEGVCVGVSHLPQISHHEGPLDMGGWVGGGGGRP